MYVLTHPFKVLPIHSSVMKQVHGVPENMMIQKTFVL